MEKERVLEIIDERFKIFICEADSVNKYTLRIMNNKHNKAIVYYNYYGYNKSTGYIYLSIDGYNLTIEFEDITEDKFIDLINNKESYRPIYDEVIEINNKREKEEQEIRNKVIENIYLKQNNNEKKKYDNKGNLIYIEDSDNFECWKEYDDKNNEIHSKESTGNEQWYDDEGNAISHNNSNKTK